MSEMNERDHKKIGKELELFTFSDVVVSMRSILENK